MSLSTTEWRGGVSESHHSDSEATECLSLRRSIANWIVFVVIAARV